MGKVLLLIFETDALVSSLTSYSFIKLSNTPIHRMFSLI